MYLYYCAERLFFSIKSANIFLTHTRRIIPLAATHNSLLYVKSCTKKSATLTYTSDTLDISSTYAAALRTKTTENSKTKFIPNYLKKSRIFAQQAAWRVP